MANYDFDGMFGDKYSTEQAINNAMFKEALSFGQLDRSKYAPMTASTFGQEYMAGAGMAGLLGGQHPMMKRQNLLDEIQKKFPDPRTPKELNELAEELTKNGFGDLAMQVRQVAMEMQKNETTASAAKLAAQTPSDSAFANLQKSLSNKMVTKEMVHGYLQHGQWDDEEGTKYGAWGSPFIMGDTDRDSPWHTQYLYDYEQAEKELKGEIENWAIDFQAQGSTKSILNQLILNPDMQVSEFEKFVDIKGNTAAGKFLADQTFVISSVKQKGLEQVSDDSASVSMDALSGATTLPASSLTNAGQTLAMNEKTWMDDFEENFNFIPSGIPT
jgi:hypothetical protein